MSAGRAIKRLLRPLVVQARRARGKVGRLVSPWTPWDGVHHPVLAKFPPWRGETDGTWSIDSFGVRTDPRFRLQFRPQAAGPVATAHPAPHAQYFELVFVLEAVAAAAPTGPFVMVELGAGYGTWLAIAATAARSLGIEELRLTGVEMVPRYFAWMKEHLRNNGIDPEAHELLHAAMSDVDGEARFRESADPDEAFGISICERGPAAEREAVDGLTCVPCMSLPTILRDKRRVDLIHCDIQGEEARVFAGCMDLVASRVERLLVSTHGTGIHRRMRRLLDEAGFRVQADFGVRERARTRFGDVQFLDGLLCAVRPGPGA